MHASIRETFECRRCGAPYCGACGRPPHRCLCPEDYDPALDEAVEPGVRVVYDEDGCAVVVPVAGYEVPPG